MAMQQGPDLSRGFIFPRRSEPAVPAEATPPEGGLKMMEMMRPASEATRPAPAPAPAPANPILTPRDCTRVIVYGKAGCPACVEAIQDLIDRQVCFTYHDVSRDERALLQLQAICGGDALVPVMIQVGLRGG